MRHGPALAAALLAMAVATGCGRCGEEAGTPPERLLAADTSHVIIIPTIRSAQEQAAALARTALRFPIAAELGETLRALPMALGVDPLDVQQVERVGLDPSGSAALAYSRNGPPLIVLPFRQRAKLEEFVERLARDRLGVTRSDREKIGGVEVVTFRAREGAPTVLSFATTGRSMVLARGARGPTVVAAAVTRSPETSLGTNAPFLKAREMLGADRHGVVAYAAPGSPIARRSRLARDGFVLGASGSATRISARAGVLFTADRERFWREVLGTATPTSELIGRLSGDTFAAIRFGGDVAALARRALPELPSDLASAIAAAGMDAERDLVGLFSRGAVASLSLAPELQLGAFSRGEIRSRDPFRLVRLGAVIETKDGAQIADALDRLARSSPPCGVTRPSDGPPRWWVTRDGLEVGLALDGNRLILASKPELLAAMSTQRASGGFEAPTEQSRSTLTAGAAAAVLDFGRLVASFRKLPASAYGTGPDAFVMRSLAERIVQPISQLTAASARVDLAPGGAVVDVVVEARPEGAAP